MIPYTVCSGSTPSQDMVALGSSRSDEQQFFRQAAWATSRKTTTSTKLRPRDGVTPAWEEELMDIEAARGYNKLREAPCPDIVDISGHDATTRGSVSRESTLIQYATCIDSW